LGNDRPAICHIYPFWIDDKDEIVYQDDHCRLYKHKVPIAEGLPVMHQTESEVRKHLAKIKKDFKDNYKEHEKIVKEFLDRNDK
jgi:Fe-S-cluster containining protein